MLKNVLTTLFWLCVHVVQIATAPTPVGYVINTVQSIWRSVAKIMSAAFTSLVLFTTCLMFELFHVALFYYSNQSLHP